MVYLVRWQLFICSLTFATFSVDLTIPQSRLQLSFILLLTTITFKFVVSQTLPRISYLTYLVSQLSLYRIYYIDENDFKITKSGQHLVTPNSSHATSFSVTHANDSRQSKAIICVCLGVILSVCLSVCLFVRTITHKKDGYRQLNVRQLGSYTPLGPSR